MPETPGDADDLARAQREVDPVEDHHAAPVAQPDPLRDKHGGARPGRRLVELQPHLPADHQLGQLLARRIGGAPLRHHFAVAHDINRVGDRHDLAQLVRDEDDGDAACAQGLQDAEQLIGLLRREHGARLVEDQDARAAIQHLHDLDALLLADRQVADERVGIDAQPVVAAEPLDLAARCREAVAQQRPGLGAEHDVLQHRERVDQHEVLMHHPDAAPERIARVADRGGLSVDENLRRCRPETGRRECSSASICPHHSRR